MNWSRSLDVLGYLLTGILLLLGVAHIINPDLALVTRQHPKTGELVPESPAFYFICALFVLMFIFIVQRKRKLFDRMSDNDQ